MLINGTHNLRINVFMRENTKKIPLPSYGDNYGPDQFMHPKRADQGCI